MDLILFRWINNWPDWLDALFYFFSEATKETPGRIALGLVLGYCLWKPHLRGPTLLALIAVGVANATTDVLKHVFQAARPCVELMDVNLRVGKLTSFGTASAHSANMAAVATAFFMRFRWASWPWIASAILTGLSRIYVGVHYPYQVLLGWLVGIFCAYVVMKTWDAYDQKRPKLEPEAATPVE
ncbi:MAG: phosphatase PAP2 family protein [Fimbriimonadaceae bacterium]